MFVLGVTYSDNSPLGIHHAPMGEVQSVPYRTSVFTVSSPLASRNGNKIELESRAGLGLKINPKL